MGERVPLHGGLCTSLYRVPTVQLWWADGAHDCLPIYSLPIFSFLPRAPLFTMPATRKSYPRFPCLRQVSSICRRATKSLHRKKNVVSPSVRGTTNTAKYTFTATNIAKFVGRRGKSVVRKVPSERDGPG